MPDFIAPSVQQNIVESEHERLRRFARAWEHYYAQAPKPLPVSPEGIDDNVRLNFAKLIVNKGVSFLVRAEHGGIGFTPDGGEDQAAIELLDDVWEPDRRSLQMLQLATNGGVTGHAFARLRMDGRVVVLDPSNVTPEWSEDDVETIERWIVQWTTVDRLTGKPVVRRQLMEPNGATWTTIDQRSLDGDTWETIGEDTWPFEFAPIADCQNLPAPNEFWGLADLEADVLDLIEGIEGVAGHMRRLVRLHGHPVPYVTGESAKNIATLQVQLGRLLAIPNIQAKVGQLELTGDLGATVTLYGKLREALHELSHIPEVATGKMENVGQLSGLALSILYGPLTEQTTTKRLTYGPFFGQIASRLVEIRGRSGKRFRPAWPPMLPQDPKADAELLEADRRMGVVSRQTVAEKRGYDWDVEQERLADEAEANAEAMARAMAAGAVDDDPQDQLDDDEAEDKTE